LVTFDSLDVKSNLAYHLNWEIIQIGFAVTDIAPTSLGSLPPASVDTVPLVAFAIAEVKSSEQKLLALNELINKELDVADARRGHLQTLAAINAVRSRNSKIGFLALTSLITVTSVVFSFDLSEFSHANLGLAISGILSVAAGAVIGFENFFGFQRKAERAEEEARSLTFEITKASLARDTSFLEDSLEKRVQELSTALTALKLRRQEGIYATLESPKILARLTAPAPTAAENREASSR
jgi:hypothetical protein